MGPDEINPEKGYISIDSPLGKAVLEKKWAPELTLNPPRPIELSAHQSRILESLKNSIQQIMHDLSELFLPLP